MVYCRTCCQLVLHACSSYEEIRSWALDPNMITIGEALEATSITANTNLVDQGDATTLQESKMRAI